MRRKIRLKINEMRKFSPGDCMYFSCISIFILRRMFIPQWLLGIKIDALAAFLSQIKMLSAFLSRIKMQLRHFHPGTFLSQYIISGTFLSLYYCSLSPNIDVSPTFSKHQFFKRYFKDLPRATFSWFKWKMTRITC